MKAKPHSLALPRWYVLVYSQGHDRDTRGLKTTSIDHQLQVLKPLMFTGWFYVCAGCVYIRLNFGSRGSRVQISPSRQVKPQFKGLS